MVGRCRNGEKSSQTKCVISAARLESHEAPANIATIHREVVETDDSWTAAWEQSSIQWGGVGPMVPMFTQWCMS